jgi:hypothetical protein
LRASWNSCEVIQPNQDFEGPRTYALYYSGIGLSGHINYLRLEGALNVMPDAWSFIPHGGCQGVFRYNVKYYGCASPSVRPGFSMWSFDPGPGGVGARFYIEHESFSWPVEFDPSVRYWLMGFSFDHSHSVSGPGNPPATCGGAEEPVVIRVSGTGMTPENEYVTWQLATASVVNSWARVKALYR